ncbi:MAG: hypothetical protein EXS64_10035 [Candidatus Latescibacteria bacterium]|nr:hypothetical protein [Candidatus Latescibacterota bacterium]
MNMGNLKSEKTCRDCGKTIPAARLEVVPETSRCIVCQEKFEKGEQKQEELVCCERCGARMVWRIRTSVLPTKYFLGCSNYPKCTYVISGSW